MAGEEETVAVFPTTQAVLLAAGVSVGLAVLYLLSLVIRSIVGALRAAKQGRQAAAKPSEKAAAPDVSTRRQAGAPAKTRGPDLKTLIKQQKAADKAAITKEDAAAQHALFINPLKGHTDVVHSIAWSQDGRGIATACADQTLRIFDVHDLTSNNLKFKWIKTQYPPLAVGFGNELSQVVAVLRGIPDIAILTQYSAAKKAKPGEQVTWETTWERQSALGRETLLDMITVPSTSDRGGVIVLLTTKKEGRVFGMGGGQIGTFEPNSLANHALAVSGNGRFIAVASFTSEVKVWELPWAKDGFKGCNKAMDLKGHTSQVMCTALNADGTRAVTASLDGTLRVWNLAVRYHMQEDPKTVLKAQLPLPPGKCYERMVLSPDGVIAAALPGGLIHFLSLKDGRLLEALHAHEAPITGMAWAPRRLSVGGEVVAVLATCSTDRRVRFWRCPDQ